MQTCKFFGEKAEIWFFCLIWFFFRVSILQITPPKNMFQIFWRLFTCTCLPMWLWTLSWKWCMSYDHLMDCVCAKYEVNPSNRHGAIELKPKKTQKLSMSPYPLTFWPKTYMLQAFCEIAGGVSWRSDDRNMVKKSCDQGTDGVTAKNIDTFIAASDIVLIFFFSGMYQACKSGTNCWQERSDSHWGRWLICSVTRGK